MLGTAAVQYTSLLLSGGNPVSCLLGGGYNWLVDSDIRIYRRSGHSDIVSVVLGMDRVYDFKETVMSTSGSGCQCNEYKYEYRAYLTASPAIPADKQNITLVFKGEPDCQFEFTTCAGCWRFNNEGVLVSFSLNSDPEITTNIGSDGQVTRQTRTTTEGTTTYHNILDFARNAAKQITEVTSRLMYNPTVDIRRMVLAYYGPSENYGSDGDLKSVTIQLPDGSGGWVDHETTYMRYYTTNGSGGFIHGLKFLVRPESFKRLSDLGDPYTATNATVADYADNYFEYDSSQRAVKSVLDGGLLTYQYAYVTSTLADDYNNWKLRTTMTRPDGVVEVFYSNYLSQLLLHDLDGQKWVTYTQYDNRGRKIVEASPSAIQSFTPPSTSANLSVTIRPATGFSRLTKYYDSTTASDTAAGSAWDFVESQSIRRGDGLSVDSITVKQSEIQYFQRAIAGRGRSFPVASQTVYRDENATDAITTSYAYTWHTDNVQIKQRTTTLPKVEISQNGSGTHNVRRELYDIYGNLTATQDERGFIDTYQYFLPTNSRIKQIQDDNPPSGSGWTAPSGTRLQLTSDYTVDDLGRTIQTLGPSHAIDLSGTSTTIRTASWTVYQDATDQVWSGQGYATGSAPSYTFTLVNPVSIQKMDDAGRTTDSITATRASTAGKLTASDSFPQSTWVRWSSSQYNRQNQLTTTRSYFQIPATGEGTVGTNYDQTTYGYDAMNRQNRVVNSVGTISRSVYDVRSLTISSYIGTNDTGATDNDPDGSGAPNNMLPVATNVYDNNTAGGDGNLTQTTQLVDSNSSNNRVTNYAYDWRNRQTILDGEIDLYVERFYDNLNQVTKTERRNTSSGGNLIARSESKFDNLGRTYQSLVYAVDPSTGTVGNVLTDNTWYDPAGNVLKQKPAGSQTWTKMVYDSVGRNTIRYVGYSTATEDYSEAGTINTSIVMEQSVSTYDAASNVIQTESAQRFHDAPTTGTGSQGALNGPNGSNPKSRNSYVAIYTDGIGRTVNVANYGKNGNSSFTRPATAPARSDTVLVSTSMFNTKGEVWNSIDPMGQATRQEFDDLGRRTKLIQNDISGGTASGQNITTQWTYTAHGQIATLTAINAATGNQTTSYSYGITVAGGSALNSNDPLRSETYPDTGVVTREYNRAGQVSKVTDQNGTVHQLDYDLLGRSVADRVTTVPSSIDTAVLRIETSYEVRGLVEKITQYDAASAGNIVNQVQRVYNSFQQLTNEYQSHAGAVNTASTPKVQYAYANGSANTIRPTEQIYPDSSSNRRVVYDYGAANGQNDKLSRVAALQFQSNPVANYTYLGLGTAVQVALPEPSVQWSLITGSGNNPYSALDRFGRVTDNQWLNTNTATVLDRIQYGYDRASNRLWRENMVAKAQTTPQYFDELYSYDGSYRLTEMQRGQLAGSPPSSVTNLRFEQDWTLDPTGNWQAFSEDANGNGTNDLVQARAANPVNEITLITNSVGAAWIQPGYDAAGNMTTMPYNPTPSQSIIATYDAWNRIVKFVHSGSVTDTCVYDGLMRRVKLSTQAGTQHYYYNAAWQVVEERLDSGTTFERQYVWGLRYIDNCVLRDRIVDSSPHRLYALQDANWNVDAVVETDGTVGERYVYSAYGVPSYLTPDFSSESDTEYNWNILYAGYRHDPYTGLYQVRYRYLHPTLGNWVSRDPLGYEGGDYSIYRYLLNNPCTITDSLGLATQHDVNVGKVSYTCKCGWIDWVHATGSIENTKKQIDDAAARNLINNVKNAIGAKVNTNVSIAFKDALFDIESFYILPANSVTLANSNEIALSIFFHASWNFEKMQGEAGVFQGQVDSSFSGEDLWSNIILFYATLRGYTRTEVEQLCGPVLTKAQSLAAFQQDGGVAKNKKPIPTYSNSKSALSCCNGIAAVPPTEFSNLAMQKTPLFSRIISKISPNKWLFNGELEVINSKSDETFDNPQPIIIERE